MQYEKTVDIHAEPAAVWEVMMAVETWPEWTASMTSLERVTPGPLAVGSEVRVKQPRLQTAVMRVTSLEEGRSFTWVNRRPGLAAVAEHEFVPSASGTTATLRIAFTGAFGWLAGLLYGSMTRRYVDMEAEGLKRRSEG